VDVDQELRERIASLEGQHREPVGRSFHLHQLDGAGTEAMVYLEPAGVRIDWVHGKGDCAITGEGEAMLAVLRGGCDPDQLEAEGHLALFGDRELIRAAPQVFTQ